MRKAPDAIVVRELHKAYGNLPALQGVDFTVARGEVFGLLGPNGAGKTTTVEILEGHRARDAGEVSVLGFDPGKRPRELLGKVGIVLQSGGMYRYLSVRESLEHWARLYPHPRSVDEVLSLCGLHEKADARVRTLSGGQARRLDLALALVGDPDLIFLDEPTTGFDPEARRQAWEAIAGLRALGKTVLLTTHYLDEAQHLCDRVAIVKDGRVRAIGAPDDLGVGLATQVVVRWRDEDGLPQERAVLDPTALVHELTAAALARGGSVAELTVTRPSLEDVYLDLTAGDAAVAAGAVPAPVPAGA